MWSELHYLKDKDVTQIIVLMGKWLKGGKKGRGELRYEEVISQLDLRFSQRWL
jgi:hypothetical protein